MEKETHDLHMVWWLVFVDSGSIVGGFLVCLEASGKMFYVLKWISLVASPGWSHMERGQSSA